MQPQTNPSESIRHLSLRYNNADSQSSALRLVFSLFPDWEHSEGSIEFMRFTDGITNTLLKAIKKRPGYTQNEIDDEAVLLRAYGKGTEVLIDRDRETASHSLLARHNLAPPLLARFQNGLMYRFIQGRVCSSADLTQKAIWKGVARRLAEWHATLPIITVEPAAEVSNNQEEINLDFSPSKRMPSLAEINAITPNKATPNIWTVMQKWILALPTGSKAQQKRKAVLQEELKRTVAELGDTPGPGKDGLVFGHCDLLSGNIVIQPPSTSNSPSPEIEIVSFIDYEYAAPSPAAFDIANHFAEWGGFECDYSVLPTRSQRRSFLYEYLQSYHLHLKPSNSSSPSPPSISSISSTPDLNAEVQVLFEQIDRFRGIPGLYWGIWALIQAEISQIDFDYAAYAEVRLGEYWAWRAEESGEREAREEKMGMRERRWACEA